MPNIQITKPYLPDRVKYKKYIDEIYDRCQLTNHGFLVKELEKRLAEYLNLDEIILVANGTMALSIAYRALEIKNEVITTPFSFVATTNSLISDGISPIFSDINSETFNIEPSLITKKINAKTSAIVPVHAFGNACDVESIEDIGKNHNLKIIYDAAHAFDVNYKKKNLLNYGDISTLSLHATKLFHTIEGGAIIVNDKSLIKKVRRLIDFGYDRSGIILNAGINAKMNEFEAAMGLCVLDDIVSIKANRKNLSNFYSRELDNLLTFQLWNKNCTKNYAYYPVVFNDEKQLLKTQKILNENNIFPRRYFYPSLELLPYIKQNQKCANSQNISERILCLPLYNELSLIDARRITDIIKKCIL
jgi:dTDP-4-amino-4,6-dideoxygalactose transaminase